MNTNPDAIRILAFGDSNTWGRVPGDDNTKRYSITERWPGILQQLLGDNYEIIEEGLNGRTTDSESPEKAGKNALPYLFSCLESHKPLDLIILSLGKNDLKTKYNKSASDIGLGITKCLKVIEQEGRNINGKIPKILLVSPGIIEEMPRKRGDKQVVDFQGGKEKSIRLSSRYQEIAYDYGIEYLDLSNVISVSKIDGVHLDTSEHQKVAKAIFSKVISMFPIKATPPA